MELDKEDAEAGSILIALANHQPQQRPSQLSQSLHNQGSMSIRNLLGDPPSDETSTASISRPRPYATVSDHGPRSMYYPPPSSSSSSSSSLPRYHQHHHQVRPAPPPSMRSAPSVAAAVAHTETTTEIVQTNTTSDPKIRRNALHAYISYMIYTDLISHHKRGGIALTKNERSSPTAFDKVPPTTTKASFSFERPMATPNHDHRHSNPDNIIHRPLTAFLRDPDPRNGNRPRAYTSIPLLPGYSATSRNQHH
ncbi:predicted protein [Lichtheimia corymbifera JMRC:FSU:9682]|uniref:Uncharacterized protein n=1 Tax=Lichtheimia corymbifera JMRC:FSU:9682 TaxID=1263082 RepID=A0A068RII2_9FUNG|nr:predicted protein [Lichtheimia corymbifera JMRC:FSU:9682]